MERENTLHTATASTRGISGFGLKMIAVISMFIDHLGATVVLGFLYGSRRITVAMRESDRLLDQLLVWGNQNWNLIGSIYEYMRLIGRIAFPIYCFLIVEGFLHTKNVKKYALRLGLFALISEIPFDLALNGRWLDPTSNNVYFTLFIGLLVIWGISWIREKCGLYWNEASMAIQEDSEEQEGKYKRNSGILLKICGILAILACIVASGFVADILYTDYAAAGVFTIVTMYLLYKQPWMGYLIAVLVLSLLTNPNELIALLGAVLICYYNGERGKNIKYFFYIFYPAHLLVFWLVMCLFGF
jgi:hypothetical protein